MQIICLAIAWKHGDWCIAGIDPQSGKWIRPISDLPDGRLPAYLIRGSHGLWPELLDVWEIPLADTGRDFGFQPENRSILPGDWKRVGRATATDLLPLVSPCQPILHNYERFVTLEELRALPPSDRCSLQLVLAADFHVCDGRKDPWDKASWKGVTRRAGHEVALKITDPEFSKRLESGHQPSRRCLLTTSLSMPYAPRWSGESPRCWKLIAGVIELANSRKPVVHS